MTADESPLFTFAVVADTHVNYLAHPKTSGFDNVGVELRHPWTEVKQITATGRETTVSELRPQGDRAPAPGEDGPCALIARLD